MVQDKRAVTKDDRFKTLHSDPRFRLPKKHDFKVKVDDRFSKADLVMKKTKAKVDKYGRKTEEDVDKDFDKYYEKEGESESEDDEEEESEADENSEGEVENDDESEEEKDEAVAALDRARGDAVASDYESSSDEASSSDEESDEEAEDSEIELEETKPEQGEPARRFAVVNMDWDHVKSTDLFATFQSFVPTSGLIESVAIYPSEFGKERMQTEEIEGPPKELFKSKKKAQEEESDSDAEIDIKDIIEEGDGKEDYDSKSLRRYQLQRLRYYYAVVTCDSAATAKTIYDNVDGTEYESTANFFDLRFVPDEMDFDDDEPRDVCTKIPKNYRPETFVTDALQHSKVKLTWDETPADRVKLSSKSFSQRELDDMDFQAYLASDNSDSEEDVNEDLKNKYKNLVGASTKIAGKDLFDGFGEEDNTGVEISFTPAPAEGAAETKDSEDENTIEKLKRKAKERRKSRKDKIKEIKQKELEEKKAAKQDPKAKKSKKNNKTPELDAKSKAELELITMDDDDKGHFKLKDLVRSEKEKSKKSKHRDNKKIVEDDFDADLNDPRFKEIFTEHDFAIDPTQPEFQQTSTMKKILDERNKRRDNKPTKGSKNNAQDQQKKKRKHEEVTGSTEDLKSLAQKVKRKAKK